MNINIITNPEKEISIMCFDVFLTVYDTVINQQFELIKPRLSGGSYVYKVDGKLRTIKWIKEKGVNVLGFINF